ncbi:MAG: hypothetical protein ACQETI_03600 [Halobacteriota archaeon]
MSSSLTVGVSSLRESLASRGAIILGMGALAVGLGIFTSPWLSSAGSVVYYLLGLSYLVIGLGAFFVGESGYGRSLWGVSATVVLAYFALVSVFVFEVGYPVSRGVTAVFAFVPAVPVPLLLGALRTANERPIVGVSLVAALWVLNAVSLPASVPISVVQADSTLVRLGVSALFVAVSALPGAPLYALGRVWLSPGRQRRVADRQ